MKPFGVRLAAGAVTILLGALAAAQAQKDKTSDSGLSWSVPPATSTTGKTPAPIAGIGLAAETGNESWIAPPPSTDPLKTLNAGRPADLTPITDDNSNVQLVQHTDAAEAPARAAEGMALPDADAFSRGAEASPADPNGYEAPALSLPLAGLGPITQNDTTESAITGEGPSMNLPLGGQPAAAATMPEEITEVDSNMSASGLVMNFDANAGQTSNNLSPQDDGAAAANTMPELQFEQPPATGFPGDSQPNFPSPESSSTASLPHPVTANTQPENMLRGGINQGFAANESAIIDNSNNLSPNPPAVIETTGFPQNEPLAGTTMGLAQNASGFGQGLAGVAQPLAADSLSPHSSLAPNSYPPANSHAPPPRYANLPNDPTLAPGYQPRTFDQPSAAMQLAIDPSDTIASPGDRRLEGVQSPSIVIQKRAPSEVKVGKPAAFVIHVQNVGAVEALDVQVHDRIPAGMRLVDASPAPLLHGDMLLWQLGAMPAGNERTVTMQLVPEQEGELGSVARVTFEAAASVRTISTRPELKIVQAAPENVLSGQQLEIELEVSNPGTGEATGVMLQEDVPDGLEHPKGRQLDNLIGALAPGEVRRQILRMRAVAPGVVQNRIRLVGDDGLAAEHTVEVEVIAPQLQVELSGPSRRFLERQATYQLDIANIGTAAASNIELSVNLDRGFTFVSTDYEGQYDPSRHAVYWSLAQLPAGGHGAVPLTLLPVEEGDQAIRLEARADLGVVAKSERLVSVDSLAELQFQIADAADPIEIGSETTYEIRVNNTGSRNDSNVRVQLQLPSGLELVSSDAEAGTNGRGLVAFQPRSQLAAGGDLVYRVRVRGVAPGTHLVKAIVTSDQASVPVTKEESTMVYADR